MNLSCVVAALRAGRLLPLVLTCTTAAAVAQRFDNWTSAPALPNVILTNLASDPVTGAPTAIVSTSTGTDTVAWNGSAFVSLGLVGNPGTAAAETLAPFSVGVTRGLVHLDSAGVTSVWTGGPSWTTLGVLTPSPSGRAFAATSSVVGPGGEAFVFGGAGATPALQDLWSFNGTAWTDRTPTSGLLPPGRFGASLSPDGLGGLLMFGGVATAGALNDLWNFDGLRWKFAGKGPVRKFHASVLDVARSELVLVGGADAAATPQNDAWSLRLPLPGIVTAANWTQITAALPFPVPPVFSTAALDTVRNEIVAVDHLGLDVVHDHIASHVSYAISPNTNCRTPALILVSATQPRVPATGSQLVPVGGLTGVANAPMVLAAEFVVPGIGVSPVPTPIAGSSCLVFLSPAATMIAATATLAGGQYQFNFVVPANPTLVGAVIDHQAFGIFGAQLGASAASRMVLGS